MRLHISKISLPERETHYRYGDFHYEDNIKVKISKFYSVKETPCYHYVIHEHDYHRLKCSNLDYLSKCEFSYVNVKKVMKGARRTYCSESKSIALDSFVKRKEKQIFHNETAISKAKLALRKVCGMTPEEVGSSIDCGLNDFLRESFRFD